MDLALLLAKLSSSALSAASRWYGNESNALLNPSPAQRVIRTLLGQPTGMLLLERHLQRSLTPWLSSNRISDDALTEGMQALIEMLSELGGPSQVALSSASRRDEFLAALQSFSPPASLSAEGAKEVFEYGAGIVLRFLRENLADSDRSAPRVAARLLEDLGRVETRVEGGNAALSASLEVMRKQMAEIAGRDDTLDPELDFTAIANTLSAPRMSRYRELMGSDQGAMRLYSWNIELSSELYRNLHLVEVVVRNAMDAELRHYNASSPEGVDEWTVTTAPLIKKVIGFGIAQAVSRAQAARSQKTYKAGRAPLCHDDYVAQMSFSTWKNLLPHKRRAAAQRKLWHECLRAAFPGVAREDGQKVADDLALLIRTRNRIAHLEPVLDRRKTHEDQSRIAAVLDAVSADARMYYEATHQFRAILKRKPLPPRGYLSLEATELNS